MKSKTSLQEILKRSRKSRRRKIPKDFQLSEEFRELGVSRRGYQLAPPNARKRAKVGEDDSSADPRTVYLRLRHS